MYLRDVGKKISESYKIPLSEGEIFGKSLNTNVLLLHSLSKKKV